MIGSWGVLLKFITLKWKDPLMICCFAQSIGLHFLLFSVVLGCPGGFRNFREADKTYFFLSSSKSDLVVPSCDQKTKVDDSKRNDGSSEDSFTMCEFVLLAPFIRFHMLALLV